MTVIETTSIMEADTIPLERSEYTYVNSEDYTIIKLLLSAAVQILVLAQKYGKLRDLYH